MSDEAPEGHYAALAVASRRRLMGLLRAAGEPTDVGTLASALGLHTTTTRFHLEVLERAGLVRHFVERGGRPGRPRQLYEMVDDVDTDDGGPGDGGVAATYRQLIELMAEALDGDPYLTPQRAEDAGRRWAEAQVPVQELSWEDGTRGLEAVFARLGFGSRLFDDEQGRHVELAACPFREAARAHPQVVCAIHAGLLRSALARMSVPDAQAAEMHPFVSADLCIADLPGRGGDQFAG